MSGPDMEPEIAHPLARWIFAAFLLTALVVGLYLSLSGSGGSDEGEVALSRASEAVAASSEPRPAAQRERPRRNPDRQPRPTESETAAARVNEELIATADDVAETTVQVLDGADDSSLTEDAVAVVSDLGYDIVAVNPSRRSSATTTVLFTEGNRAEAHALRASDPRFGQIKPNTLFSESVDLHVVVGEDWRP